MTRRNVAYPLTFFSVALLGFVACGGHTSTGNGTPGDDGGGAADDGGGAGDGSNGDGGANADGSTGDSSTSPDSGGGNDGTPMRKQCTNAFGTGLSTTFGRLDGFLVAIVAPGTRGCNGDMTHVHLQVLAQNSVYDVAVNVDGEFHEQDLQLPGGPWTEGWHTNVTDSYASLGVHSGVFMQSTVAQLGPVVEMALANANHISVFATGYAATGVHLVHFDRNGHDGMVVTNPLSSPSHALMFAFQGDTF